MNQNGSWPCKPFLNLKGTAKDSPQKAAQWVDASQQVALLGCLLQSL